MVKPYQFGYGYNKRVKTIIFIVFLGVLFSAFPVVGVYAQPKVSSYVVLEADSLRVLYSSNSNVKMEPASTTKILTAICVIENGDVEKIITIPKQAVGVEGSSIYLKEGEKFKIVDLLYGLMMRSGNDAAVALALSVSGSLEKFALLMRDTAFKIGAYNSNFVNPHGLHHDEHYTTAEDLAKITAYAYKLPLFKEIVSSKTHYFERDGKRECFVNKNKMLSLFSGANGVKTGYTKSSGRCLVSGAIRDGMQLICVVLNESDMWAKSAELLDRGFKDYTKTLVFPRQGFYVDGRAVKVARDIYFPLKQDEKLDYEYLLTPSLDGANREIGIAQVKISNHLIFSEKLYTI